MTLAAEEQANPPSPPPQSRNHLLAVVPPSEFLELQTHLTPVDLRPRQRLSESNQDIEAVYFPHDTVLSMAAVDRDGGTIEVASVGCEGMAGLPVLLGADQSTNRVSVQIGGRADRMDASVLRREARRHEEFGRLLHLYTQAFMTQIAQSTACNRLHSAEQRLARWLLICRDRVQRDELPITQETMAAMLGVRRATVTESAGDLQRSGVIRYRRGVIVIVNRPGLEAASCECYDIVREEFDRLLGVRVG